MAVSLTRGGVSSRQCRRYQNRSKRGNTAAHEIVRRIDALYAIEREIKQLPDEERAQVRQVRAVPLLDSLHTFAQSLQTQTLTSGKLGEALAYLTKQWPKLIRYIEDGHLAIDTNLAENAIVRLP